MPFEPSHPTSPAPPTAASDAGAARPVRVTVYVDGFNLYHGLKEHSKARAYRWLDLHALSESLLLPGHRLEKVLYFTSLPPWSPQKIARHQVYIDALKSVGVTVVEGRFQKDTRTCFAICRLPFDVYVEKLTDVNIATRMIEDAVLDRTDWIYLVTGDADQAPAIRTLRTLVPQKVVRVIFPPRRHSAELQQVADEHLGPIGHRKLKPFLLPDAITLADGRTIHNPDGW
ncbi:MAG TPA: NYN domain-containing protein [Longimicrobium sp.]|jgi:uncharacterized LabA/DUF88 family protein